MPLIIIGDLVGWLVGFAVISRKGPKTERLTILRAATHETELGDHDFYLSRSHYTDTDPTSRERAATARSTDWATAPPIIGDRMDTVLREHTVHFARPYIAPGLGRPTTSRILRRQRRKPSKLMPLRVKQKQKL